MTFDITTFLEILGTAITIGTIIYKWNNGISNRYNMLEDKYNKMHEEMSSFGIKVSLFWSIIETEVPKMLHSPHTPEFDNLLEQFTSKTLNLDSAYRLRNMLQDDINLKREIREKGGGRDGDSTDFFVAELLFLPVLDDLIIRLRKTISSVNPLVSQT